MGTTCSRNRSIVSLLSRSDSTLEAASLVALFVAVSGCLGRALLHFL